ncbi:NAD(P)-dependent oxidoreductase [Aerophototrophica crusticola]|uniref:NAD(P)-dependent oxidoreductase n=1 Tax=Aerophototrophica crusticola TaxID=1709002 RepID=A0A858RBC9_9PROT|nr:NAD(P)-dependent oxidoreductase [Rhodospirillaceae bacterium B3]
MDIGFIGLGNMGSAMVANLLKAGHRVRVWNRTAEAARALADKGAVPVDRPHDAFGGDAVLSMLADDRAVRAVLLDGGVLEQAPAGLVHANMATISVALAQELAERHAARGIGYVAAPVFGRPPAAAAAQLNIVTAGAADALARVQPLFDVLGQRTWPVGDDPVRANVVKLSGNFMIAAAIEAMGEATTLAAAYGVEPRDLLEILTNTLFAAPAYKGYGEQIASGRYEPAGFKLALGLKDVRLALEAGEGRSVPLPLGSLLRDGFLDSIAHGDGEKDWAALALVARRRAGQG